MTTGINFHNHCILIYELKGAMVNFFCDGINPICAMQQLPDIGKIKIDDLYSNISNKTNWEQLFMRNMLTHSPPLNMYSELLDYLTLSLAQTPLRMKLIDVTGNDARIWFGEEREFNFTFNPLTYPEFFNNGFEKLLINCFGFGKSIASSVVKVLKDNPSNYIAIDPKGKILQIFESFDEYINSDLYSME